MSNRPFNLVHHLGVIAQLCYSIQISPDVFDRAQDLDDRAKFGTQLSFARRTADDAMCLHVAALRLLEFINNPFLPEEEAWLINEIARFQKQVEQQQDELKRLATLPAKQPWDDPNAKPSTKPLTVGARRKRLAAWVESDLKYLTDSQGQLHLLRALRDSLS